MQTVRGSITDRPWGQTLGALGVEARTVQLTVAHDDKTYQIVFDRGVVVSASSPLTVDSVTRVALTTHQITPAQVSDVKRRIAAAPSLDEVDILAAAVHLSADQARALRLRLITQRAARTFAIERGSYELEERTPQPIAEGGIDVRSVVYLGARLNLSEQRLAYELRQLGTRFALAADPNDELSRYGFTKLERPILDALRAGTSLPELEASFREIDPRTMQAVIYALASCNALVELVTPAAARTPTPRDPVVARTPTPRDPVVARTPTPRDPVVARTPTPRDPVVARTPTPRDPVVARTPTPRAPVVFRVPPRESPAPPPLPPAPAVSEVPSGAPEPLARQVAHTVPVERLPRSMLESFRTGCMTTVRPNALSAYEVEQLIAERTALLDAGADHFTLLGVAIGAPIEEIHGAYVELSRHLRPARLAELGISDDSYAASRLLAQIGIAFTVLTDRYRRAEYLATLKSQRRRAAGQPKSR